MSRRLPLLFALAAAAFVLPASAAHAKGARVYTDKGSQLAVGGYDTVAYFTEGRPVKGDPQFVHRYEGAEWQFASAANRDLFAVAPARYAPQYGGYCAWAVSQGYTASADPHAWKVVDDKLYLNYDASIQQRWEKDIPGLIRKANQHWPAVLDK